MHETMKIPVRTPSGLAWRKPVPPVRWQGQVDCVVGPFSSRRVAENYARPAVDFGHYDIEIVRIFAKRDAWYIEVAAEGGADSASRA